MDKEVVNDVVETDEIDESSELDKEVFTYSVNNTSSGNNYNDKKSFIYIIIGVLVLILVIVFLVVFVNGGSKKVSKYTDIEDAMVKGASDYYKKYSDLLPINSTEVDTDTLIQNSFLKPFSEMVSDGVSCKGYVSVTKSGDDYTYFPYLDCGDSYKSLKLVDKIIDDSFVSSGDGLYSDNDEYIFRGEYPKNYVSFDDKMWRIIGINADHSMKLLLIDEKFERVVWDDRYNSSKGDYSGINTFSVSRLLEYLNNIYDNDTIISKKNKNLLVNHDWCIGKLNENDMAISDMNLCSEIYSDLYIGVIEADEVLKASIDVNCVNMYDSECTNYNYFLNINTGWTLNASSNKTYNVFSSSSGSISYSRASTTNYVRPVININANVLYKSGDGTKDNPYKFN